jgi:integrase/recombinase XerC
MKKKDQTPERKPSSTALPYGAEAFVDNVAGGPNQAVTRKTYLMNLLRLQTAAENMEQTGAPREKAKAGEPPLPLKHPYAQPGVPLEPTAIGAQFLLHYFLWLQSAKRGRNHEPYSVDTQRLSLVVARRYLGWLDVQGLLAKNVTAEDIEKPLKIVLGKRKASLHRQPREVSSDVGALLTYYGERLSLIPHDDEHRRQRLITLRNHALMLALFATAGRAAEVVQFTVIGFDESKKGEIKVKGKGSKDRLVYLTPSAQQAIRAYLRARGNDHHPALFIAHSRRFDGRRLAPKAVWRVVDAAALAVFGKGPDGRPCKHVGPHAIRHLAAQSWVDEGMPIETVQKLLGHEDISTTRTVYAPSTPQEMIADQVATFSRKPEEVAGEARRRIRRKAADD